MKSKTTQSIFLVAAVLCLALPRLAFAHAFLDTAEPRVGSTVASSPPRVVLHFTQDLEPAFSTMKVLDATGKQVDTRDVTIDSHDAAAMSVSLPSLPAGTYKVEWRVTSVDTHQTHGSFEFAVAPKG